MRLFLRSLAVLVALAHKLFLKKEKNFPPLSMAPTWLNRKLQFDMAILLGSTWSGILKLHSHAFLFASPFKVIIYTSIVTVQIPGQTIILPFKNFHLTQHHIIQIGFFF